MNNDDIVYEGYTLALDAHELVAIAPLPPQRPQTFLEKFRALDVPLRDVVEEMK